MKTYWLISSNTIPSPEKRKNTLLLHGVNAYDVQKLEKINHSKIFILSDITLDSVSHDEYPFAAKLSMRDKFELFVKVLKLLPSSIKLSISIIAVYFIAFLFISAYGPSELSIYTAIISTIITFVSCFFPIFTDDKKHGAWVILFLSIALGILIGKSYFHFESYFVTNSFLNRNRIGNSLTALGMIFTFIASIKTTITSFIYDILSTSI